MAKNQSEFAVHLSDEKGRPVVVLPGEDLPGWAKVSNPYVLGKEVEPEEVDDDEESDGPPSKRAGLAKWAAYAEAHGVDADGLDKAEIIAELEGAGVPVE